MDNNVFVKPPEGVIDGLDDDYLEIMDSTQREIIKRGFEHYFIEHMRKAEASDEWLYDLPHPNRKRWANFVPLHMELFIQEEPAVQFLMSRLAEKEIQIGKLITSLVKHSPSFREMALEGNKSESGTNFGNLDPMVFPHAFWAKSSRMFKLDERLVQRLDKTDLGIKAPCGFIQAPFNNMFIHASPDVMLHNAASGDHRMDGIYINQYTIGAERVDAEWDEANQYGSLNHCLVEKGLMTRNGGEARVIEFLATGRPKDAIFDDATFNFVFLMQDPTSSVKELLEAHIDYYVNRVRDANAAEYQGFDMVNAGDRDVQQMKDIMEFAVKALLYINSEDSTREKVMELTDLKMAAKRTYNKAKIRKIERKMHRANDYIYIGFKGEYESGEGEAGAKSAHWRRGHFRLQRYGEKRSESRMIWIQPTMVGKDKPVSKEYKVR